MKRLLVALSTLPFALHPRTLRAGVEQPAASSSERRMFGDAGNFVIGGDFSAGLDRTHANDDSYSATTFYARPSLDYFLFDHVSIGTGVGFQYNTYTSYGLDGTQCLFSLAPRVGYEIPLGDVVSFWPTAGVFYYRVAGENGYVGRATSWDLSGYARAPLIAHVAKHFFVGAGPTAGVSLAQSSEAGVGSWSAGFNSMLGGWW